MAMLVINSVTVSVALNGVSIQFEHLLDTARSIDGSLLVTRTDGNTAKEIFSVPTTPLTTTDKNTLLTELVKPFVDITGDLAGSRTVSPRLTGITPVTLPGPVRRWIVFFDMITV